MFALYVALWVVYVILVGVALFTSILYVYDDISYPFYQDGYHWFAKTFITRPFFFVLSALYLIHLGQAFFS